jgi:general secretion pathway protein F
MVTFHYRALSKSGAVLAADVDLPSRQALLRHVEEQGCLLLSAERAGAGSVLALLNRDLSGGGRLGAKDLVLLMQQLSSLFRAGLTVDRALQVTLAVGANERTKSVVRDLLSSVRGGSGLADAMTAVGAPFNASLIAMARAGEESGALGDVLVRAAETLGRQRAVAEQLRSALIYPATLVGFAVLSIVILITAVLPEFRPLFEMAGKDLPTAARVLLKLGDLAGAYWWVALAAVGAAIVSAVRLLSVPAARRRLQRFLLGVPIVGRIVINVETARFCRLLSTLLLNGVTLLKAMSIAREAIRNTTFAHAIEHAERELKRGSTLAEPLEASPFIPRLLPHMVRVGEETGQLQAMVSNVAEVFEREVQTSTQRLLALLVPAVTILMGLVIAGIITTILTTMLSINDLAV